MDLFSCVKFQCCYLRYVDTTTPSHPLVMKPLPGISRKQEVIQTSTKYLVCHLVYVRILFYHSHDNSLTWKFTDYKVEALLPRMALQHLYYVCTVRVRLVEKPCLRRSSNYGATSASTLFWNYGKGYRPNLILGRISQTKQLFCLKKRVHFFKFKKYSPHRN